MTAIRNIISCVLAGVLLLTAITGCKKDEPVAGQKLAKGVKLEAAGEPIDIEVGHLVPCACDWNSDGKKDLLVGQFKDGAIHLYLNEGTDASPVFGEYSLLEAGGKPIKLDAG